MARTAHKKSRRGCATCKQRHVKCDETRPSCINCATVRRRCPYLDIESASSKTVSPGSTHAAEAVTLPAGINHDLLFISALNQWCNHTQEIYCPTENPHHPGTIMLDLAIQHPFLLHALLALSSFHLGATESTLRKVYRDQSDRLLKQGLEGFNTIVLANGLTEDNILAAFVFSNVVGLTKFAHLFSTMHNSVEDFIDSFVACVTLLRGVSIVLQGWWPFILKSKLLQALYPTPDGPPKIDQNTEELPQLADLRALLEASKLSTIPLDSCREVVRQLQGLYNDSGKDNQSADELRGFPESVWIMKFPAEFHVLLTQKKPEALIIIAHAAPLLHRRRQYWLVGNAGQVLMNGVGDFLGHEWSSWLDIPRKLIDLDP